jgi:hypothetical protein
MTPDISHPYAFYDDVPQLLQSELRRSQRHGQGNTVVHAGHYMLHVGRDGNASDYLGEDSKPRPGVEAFDFFTKATWRMACNAIHESGGNSDLKLMVLVNDWQYLVWRDASKRESERKAAALRAAYYSSFSGLPYYHQSELGSHGLGADSVLHASASRTVFSESGLRQELTGTIKKLLKNPVDAERLGLRRSFDEHGEPFIQVETPDCTGITLLQCGNTNCAGEVVELLHQLQQRGIRNFINLYPAQCEVPVRAGTDLAAQLFGLADMVITNIAIPCSEPSVGSQC